MVSFWPFKGGSSDAAAFEKELSQLSTKINKATAQTEQFQQRRRRYKVLWTLYTSFTYTLIATILTLVTGWDKWGAAEYSAMAGGPVLIYIVRTGLDAFYNYRLATSQKHLNDLQKQRAEAIKRLKAATKYDSTHQLLEKYGGSPPTKKQAQTEQKSKRQSEVGAGGRTHAQQPRTGFMPPPTANIPSRQPPAVLQQPAPPNAPGLPQRAPTLLPPPGSPEQSRAGEEFAPNAFSPQSLSRPPTLRQPQQYATEGPKWYDRIMDVVLGEDETHAKNRLALICENCRLVNGQAPPGATTLEDVGKWRCSSCHTMNGVESEENKILQQISGEPPSPTRPNIATQSKSEDVGEEFADNAEASDDDHVEGSSEEVEVDDAALAASTRGKARQRKKA